MNWVFFQTVVLRDVLKLTSTKLTFHNAFPFAHNYLNIGKELKTSLYDNVFVALLKYLFAPLNIFTMNLWVVSIKMCNL